jgi:hypothetical protein
VGRHRAASPSLGLAPLSVARPLWIAHRDWPPKPRHAESTRADDAAGD